MIAILTESWTCVKQQFSSSDLVKLLDVFGEEKPHAMAKLIIYVLYKCRYNFSVHQNRSRMASLGQAPENTTNTQLPAERYMLCISTRFDQHNTFCRLLWFILLFTYFQLQVSLWAELRPRDDLLS